MHALFTIEVARQLRGECGERQVAGARTGPSLAQGPGARLRRHPDHGWRLAAGGLTAIRATWTLSPLAGTSYGS